MVPQLSGHRLFDHPEPSPPLHRILRSSLLLLHSVGKAVLLHLLGRQEVPPERQADVRRALRPSQG